MVMQLRAGTSGYSYNAWRGNFYPEDLAPEEWLAFYASQLPAVEINNTFHRMPKTSVVEGWRDATSPDFRFVIKASRRITHQHRLNSCAEPMKYLVQSARTLGDKLGAVLFQLPPYMPLNLSRLQTFQDLLPEDIPAAFEFRHDSWLDHDVDAALASRGHARVVAHDETTGDIEIPDGGLVYLRLRAFNYSASALRKWHGRIITSGARRAYVFFKHEEAGAGPAMARAFLDVAKAATPARASRKATRAKKALPAAAQAASTKPRPGTASRRQKTP